MKKEEVLKKFEIWKEFDEIFQMASGNYRFELESNKDWMNFFNTFDGPKWTQNDFEGFTGLLEERHGRQELKIREIVTKFVVDGFNVNHVLETMFRCLIEFPNDDELDDFEFFKDQITQLNNFFYDIDAEIQSNLDWHFDNFVEGCEFAAQLISMFWDKLSPEFLEDLREKTHHLDISDIEDKQWWEYEDDEDEMVR